MQSLKLAWFLSQYFYNSISSLYDMLLHYYFRFTNPNFLLGKQYYSVFYFKLDFFWHQYKFAVTFLSNQKLFSTGFYKYTNLCIKLQILVTTNSIFCNRHTQIPEYSEYICDIAASASEDHSQTIISRIDEKPNCI